LNLERYDEAVIAYRKVIELKPLDSAGYYLLGVLLHNNLHTYGEAEVNYKKAIEFDASNFDFYDSLVRLFRYELINKLEDTIPLLEKMIEIRPQDFNSYLAAASIEKQLGRNISPEHLAKVRQFLSDDDFYNKACLESVCNNLDLAFEYLQKAAQKEKFDPAWAWEDPDLQWIRDDPRFVEIVGPKPESENLEN
jgi:tetratricopeptide (TPR) repeat protein